MIQVIRVEVKTNVYRYALPQVMTILGMLEDLVYDLAATPLSVLKHISYQFGMMHFINRSNDRSNDRIFRFISHILLCLMTQTRLPNHVSKTNFVGTLYCTNVPELH